MKAIDYCTSTLYSAALLWSLTNSKSCFPTSLDFLCRQLCHLGTKFYFFLPIGITFLSFLCLVALARTFTAMLKRNGEKGHHCLIPDLSEKASSRPPLTMMLPRACPPCTVAAALSPSGGARRRKSTNQKGAAGRFKALQWGRPTTSATPSKAVVRTQGGTKSSTGECQFTKPAL